MSEHEVKLRDDLAKIAFDRILQTMMANKVHPNGMVEKAGRMAFDAANEAMRARFASSFE